MSTTQDVSSVVSSPASQPYSVSANVTDSGVDVASSTVNGTSSAAASSTAAATGSQMGENEFLQLLVTQLQNQDPLNPMDNTTFVTQLAQFQQLEGTNNIQTAIKSLNTSFTQSVDAQKQSAASLTTAAAISLIGKAVRMNLSAFDWSASSGSTIGIPVYLGSADQATVQIKDQTGAVVRTLTASGKDSNNVALCKWDGTTDNGQAAPAGSYTVAIPDQASGIYAFVDGSVDGVSNLSSGVKVSIGGVSFNMSDIVSVSNGTSQS